MFGTSCPPKGLSDVLRRLSYRRYGEARAAHRLLLVLADRVDAVEHHLASLVSPRPDRPITETGVVAELRHPAAGGPRADRAHRVLDPLPVAEPWVAAAAVGGGRGCGRCAAAGSGTRTAHGELSPVYATRGRTR